MIYFGGDSFILICQIATKVMVRGEQTSVLTGKHLFLFNWINPVRYQVHNNQIKLIYKPNDNGNEFAPQT